MSTMIQIGEIRRYYAGERVPWWCMFQRPNLMGWPRFGRVTFGCDVEVSLDHELRVHVHQLGNGYFTIVVSNASFMNVGPPGRGWITHIHAPETSFRVEG